LQADLKPRKEANGSRQVTRGAPRDSSRGTPRDANFLAWVLLAASRGHLSRGWFDIALNAAESRCLEFLKHLATTQPPSWWHYSRFLVAAINAQPVAALSAFRAGEAYSLSQAAMSEVAEALALAPPEQAAIWRRGSYIFLCAMGGHDDCWTVENVAVLRAYRGRGLINALLSRALEDGAAQGLEQAQVTFAIGNEAAERAYAKAGFSFGGERRHPEFEAVAGAPGLRRLVRQL